MGTLLWVGAEELRWPVVGVLPDHVEGSGCEFTRFDAPDGSLPVLYTGGIEGAYMNIHGRIMTLPQADDIDTGRLWYYGTGPIKVILDLGKPHMPDDIWCEC